MLFVGDFNPLSICFLLAFDLDVLCFIPTRVSAILGRVITSHPYLLHLRLHTSVSFNNHSLILVAPNIYSHCTRQSFCRTKKVRAKTRNPFHKNISLLEISLSKISSRFPFEYATSTPKIFTKTINEICD